MSFDRIYNVVSNITFLSILIPITFSIIKFKALNFTLRALFVFFLLSLSTDAFFYSALASNNRDATVIANIYTIAEGIVVGLVFLSQLNLKKEMIVLSLSLLAFVIFAVSYFFFIGNISADDNVVSTIEAGLIIVFSSLFFFKLLMDDKVRLLSEYYFYWINLSFLIYFCGGFILFMNTSFISEAKPTLAAFLWGLHQLLSITCNILFSIGIWKFRKH